MSSAAPREERLARVRQGICETIAPHDLRVDRDEECLADIGTPRSWPESRSSPYAG